MSPEIKKQSNRFDVISKVSTFLVFGGVGALFLSSYSGIGDSVSSFMSLISIPAILLGIVLNIGGRTVLTVRAGKMAIEAGKEIYDASKETKAESVASCPVATAPFQSATPNTIDAVPSATKQGNGNDDRKAKVSGGRVTITPAKTLAEVNPPLHFSLIFTLFPLVVALLMGSEFNEVKVAPFMYVPVLMFSVVGLVLCAMSVASLVYGRQMVAGKSDLELAQIEYRDIEEEEASARIGVEEAVDKASFIEEAGGEGSALRKIYSSADLQQSVFNARQRLVEIQNRKQQVAERIIRLGGTPQSNSLLAIDPKAALEAFEEDKPSWVDFLERKLMVVFFAAFAVIVVSMFLLAR